MGERYISVKCRLTGNLLTPRSISNSIYIHTDTYTLQLSISTTRAEFQLVRYCLYLFPFVLIWEYHGYPPISYGPTFDLGSCSMHAGNSKLLVGNAFVLYIQCNYVFTNWLCYNTIVLYRYVIGVYRCIRTGLESLSP